ncbi:hypothetical protein HYDPIDRAFT_119843 [Hydnomerulius pinastri MD-312]|uniref:Uncharacterized protein n=1 Tax=Hydnomerulius pinastri MD-312 TaxID=994086 RepID=A0A0C9W697_9AGAM|nr:hypothetical protein HYDPIDRAFT_119843 [Hydnomerulius pinastri MD-312]
MSISSSRAVRHGLKKKREETNTRENLRVTRVHTKSLQLRESRAVRAEGEDGNPKCFELTDTGCVFVYVFPTCWGY